MSVYRRVAAEVTAGQRPCPTCDREAVGHDWLNCRDAAANELTSPIADDLDKQVRELVEKHLRSVIGTDACIVDDVRGFYAAITAALQGVREAELKALWRRNSELTLDEGFSSHYQRGFELFRDQMEAVIKSRLAAITAEGERGDGR